jgi:hypothetical protein
MKRSNTLLFLLFIWIAGVTVSAQTVPDTPHLCYVTVDPETGYDKIVWHTSSPLITDYYKVLLVNNLTTPLTTYEIEPPVYVPDTVYINYNSDSHNNSVGYSVVAYNDLGGGPTTWYLSLWDPPDSTIFLESEFDSCQAEINLAWNDYNNWRGSIAAYNIYRRRGPGIYELLNTVNEGTNTIVLTNLDVNQPYELFVEAVHVDGRKSTSNRVDVFTGLTVQPGFINADYATISSGNFVDLSFTLDPASTLTHYNLMRSTSMTGVYTLIASFNTPDNHIMYTDETSFTSSVYYYRLDVLNNCGQVADQSNLANNIILNGSITNMNALLQWNEYKDWVGNVDHYTIIRTRGHTDPVVDNIFVGLVTNYTDDIGSLVNYEDPESSYVCYEVLATENPNTYGIQGKSLSNRVCFSVNPDIRMPNAIIPNDNEPLNKVFEPVFSFLPEHYDIIIYNRLGTKIWEGSTAWDGRENGKYVPEGVYLYYLRVYNYSTDIIELNGSVTVVYR